MKWALIALASLGWGLGISEARAALPPEALQIVRRIAIQHNGRHKPFDSFARETLEQITGSPTFGRPPTASVGTSLGDPAIGGVPRLGRPPTASVGTSLGDPAIGGVPRLGREDPVETVLSIIASPDRWQAEPLIWVPFVPLREMIGMDRAASRISYNDLVASRKLMRLLPPIVQKEQRDEKISMLEQETMDAFGRFVSLSRVLEQEMNLVPPSSPSERVWVSILHASGYPDSQQAAFRDAWASFIAAVNRGDGPAITAAAARLRDVLREANPSAYPARWRLELEVFYNHATPFRAARILYLLAALGLLLGLWSRRGERAARVGMIALWAAFLLHAAGILMRVVIGGRPPVSNFYETTLWLPFVAVIVALVFERIYRVRYFGLAAAILAAITLLLSDHLPLDPSISPVVAVLHSHLWLTIHVLTIVASYGALALATVLAHLYGVVYFARRRGRSTLADLDLWLYRSIQVGVVLLAAGIMLGAVWANASWGRYWGWDPKETWALITLLWFIAVLHGRFAGWIRGVGVALATITGFFLLLMTYYGVSFYLVGLHSYAGGHAKPLPPLLIGYLIAELAFLAFVGLAALLRAKRFGAAAAAKP